MTSISDENYAPTELLKITAEKLQAVEPIMQQLHELKIGNKTLDNRQLSNFREYTKYLDKTVNRFKELAHEFEDQFNDMNQWWNKDDEQTTDNDIRELRNHIDKFLDTIDSIFNLYKETLKVDPPNDCSSVHYELKELIESLLTIPDECRHLFKKYVDNPQKTLEEEEKITFNEDGLISIEFG